MFRFGERGNCHVYNMKDILAVTSPQTIVKPYAEFTLERTEDIMPHSNAVMFGREFYQPEDEFPLLYTNVYNTYEKQGNLFKGVCCVYRLRREGARFSSTLVQLIEIGFVEDLTLWRSYPDREDARPFGNFTIDPDKGIYYAFVSRDKDRKTRYFAFDLPKASDGVMDETFGVNKVVLKPADIQEYFDCDYHIFIQGACFHADKIYSLEGFGAIPEKPPVLRVIDIEKKQQIFYANFRDYGLAHEPEWIDFKDGVCYYADANGRLYILTF